MGRSFLLLLLVIYSFANGQQARIDSLKDVASTIPNDVTKVKVYAKLSTLYIRATDDTELATKYADSVMLLSKKLGFEKGKAQGHYLIASIQKEMGEYHEALTNFQLSSELYFQNQDSLQAMHAVQGMAQVYSYQGEYEKGLDLQFLIARFYENKNKPYSVAVSFSSIATIFRKVEKYDDAKKFHQKSLGILKEHGFTRYYAMGLQNLANVYAATNDYDSALNLYIEALQVIRGAGSRSNEAYILSNMGYIFGELTDYKKAIEYQIRAVAIWQELDQTSNTIEAFENLGDFHTRLEEFEDAEGYYKQALLLSEEVGARALKADIYKGLSELNIKRNNYKTAYEYYDLSTQLKDSIFDIENAAQINELQTKYETEKKEKQITLLAKEKELQKKETARQATLKWTFILGTILLIAVSGLVIYNSRQKLKNQKLLALKDHEIREVNYKQQMSELEMKALRAQVNPHFLFNCMNSINGMILEGDNDNASRYLTKFSKLVRLILENAEGQTVSLQNEVSLLESYIQLEGLRFKGKIDYRISIDNSVNPDAIYLPSMVLQPFVENAIWHGLMHKSGQEKGVIDISVKENEGRLYCIIEDNGVGRAKARELADKSVLKSKSMGMKITEERLRLMVKERWSKLINITDLKNSLDQAIGTRVEINIPISI